MNTSENFLLVRSVAPGVKAGGLGIESLEPLVVRAIRRILESGDATTYQICEALIQRLTSSDFGEGVSVDVAGLLQDNFWYYESPSTGGYLIRKWTLDQERAKAYWKSQKKKYQPGSLIFPPIDAHN